MPEFPSPVACGGTGLGVGLDVAAEVGIEVGLDVGAEVGIGVGLDVGAEVGIGVGLDIHCPPMVVKTTNARSRSFQCMVDAPVPDNPLIVRRTVWIRARVACSPCAAWPTSQRSSRPTRGQRLSAALS